MGIPAGKQFEGCVAGCIMTAKDVHILPAGAHEHAVSQGEPDFALERKGCPDDAEGSSVTTGSLQEEGRRGAEKGI